AVAEWRRLRKQSQQIPQVTRAFVEHLLDCLCQEKTTDELLKFIGRSREDECMAHYFLGMNRLADGDRKGAREHFEKSIASRCFYFGDYDWSWMFLNRMTRDPAWPSWIQGKQLPG